MNKNLTGFVIVFLFFLIAPNVGNTFWLELLIATLYLAYQGMAWSIIGGLTGQISLGHPIFIAIGSYTSTYLLINNGLSPLIGMFLGAIMSAVVALLIGFVSFRYKLQGIFFAMVTLAFCQVLRILIENIKPLGGAYGLLIPVMEDSWLAFQFSSKLPYYYILLAMVIVMLIIIRLITKNKMGSYLISIRENEQAAEAIGINPFKYKMIAFMLSGFFGALGGSFMAQYTLFIDPHMADWSFGITILIAVIAGGMKHPLGPLVGAIVLQPISEVIRLYWGEVLPGLHLVIYGIILIVIVMYMPDGVIKGFKDLMAKRKLAAINKNGTSAEVSS
ncbi:branched-chain amino acid ABC transporter permease [Bacillus sp. FJAT-29953]|nr:branched-chain amino acid ABC transporter permease [Bacillus sp. FJAT-29953]